MLDVKQQIQDRDELCAALEVSGVMCMAHGLLDASNCSSLGRYSSFCSHLAGATCCDKTGSRGFTTNGNLL